MLTVENSSQTVVLRMAGDLDLGGVGKVMRAVDAVDLERTSELVLDLENVTFLDISALKTILRANDYCKDNGIHTTVVTPRGLASRVFTLTRAHRDLNLVEPEYRRHIPSAAGVRGLQHRRFG
jgi:anti-anti-sigma factor